MYRTFGKRAVDVVVGCLLMFLAAPIMICVAVAIWIGMGTPILFRQKRGGYRGTTFVLNKFRTMSAERNEKGEMLTDAQRLTGVGKLIRNLSLDELPQLWNVVKGDMSMIGPRPLLAEYLTRYNEHQRRRHDVRPGITGWAQVNGRNLLSWEQKFDLDVWYVDHRSAWLDLKIVGLTILGLLRTTGVSAAGHATMPVFLGSEGQAAGDESATDDTHA